MPPLFNMGARKRGQKLPSHSSHSQSPNVPAGRPPHRSPITFQLLLTLRGALSGQLALASRLPSMLASRPLRCCSFSRHIGLSGNPRPRTVGRLVGGGLAGVARRRTCDNLTLIRCQLDLKLSSIGRTKVCMPSKTYFDVSETIVSDLRETDSEAVAEEWSSSPVLPPSRSSTATRNRSRSIAPGVRQRCVPREVATRPLRCAVAARSTVRAASTVRHAAAPGSESLLCPPGRSSD